MTETKELQDLKTKISEMSQQLMNICDKIKALEAPSLSTPSPREVVYVAREQKVRHFNGDNQSVPIEDFIEEIMAVIQTRVLSKKQQADFIVLHLDGSARDEIRLLDPARRSDPAEILRALQEAFGERRSSTQLFCIFYDRHQRENESLREFSYAL